MAKTITVKSTDGREFQFIDEVKAQGGMKDVKFSPQGDYVVAFLREKSNMETRDRLEQITDKYRRGIFEQEGGEYLKKLYCWPIAVVEYQEQLGVVVPFYRPNFFFNYGSFNNDVLNIKGKEKDGKWFAAATNRYKFLDQREIGNRMNFIKICLTLSRAVRRMHMAGLSHSDLGYKNCLIDPTTGDACLIDIDGLVVPGKHPPAVIGTPDFIAPEVVATQHLPVGDPRRILPSRSTDLHALAVLIYMYLLCRHPLRGRRVLDADPQKDEALAMGEKALFVEHPNDTSNRINLNDLKPDEQFWGDTDKLPYSVNGPYLASLFRRAFVEGLHEPSKRPSANEWEEALIKTLDLLQPCPNPNCTEKFYVFDNKKNPKCPFCGTPYKGKLPVLILYSQYQDGSFKPDNHSLMVYSGQSLFKWHMNRNYYPNEKIKAEDARKVGYFVLHNNEWYLVNEGMPTMRDITNKQDIKIGGNVALKEGVQILLDQKPGGRLIFVQMSGS